MKKRQSASKITEFFNPMQDYLALDHNSRKAQSSNVMDLVTHREKMMDEENGGTWWRGARGDRTGGNRDDREDWGEFEEGCEGNQHQHVEKKMQRQLNNKLLQKINHLISKNKINSKTSFEVPILEVKDFMTKSEENQGDVVWSKMSSIMENDYKIYGLRIDLIEEQLRYVHDLAYFLGRGDLQELADNGKDKNVKQDQENVVKFSDLMSTEVRNNLMLHLEKNSENLDINLRKKLVLRKDPLFERTSRRFDHTTFASFFMNTLAFSDGLYIQINNCEKDDSSRKGLEQQKFDGQKQMMDQENSSNDRFQQKPTQILTLPQNIKQLIITQSQNQQLQNLSFPDELKTFRTNLQIQGTKILPSSPQSAQQCKSYQKILTMIQKGQLKSAFQYGQVFSYIQSSNEAGGGSGSEDDERGQEKEEEGRFNSVNFRVYKEERIGVRPGKKESRKQVLAQEIDDEGQEWNQERLNGYFDNGNQIQDEALVMENNQIFKQFQQQQNQVKISENELIQQKPQIKNQQPNLKTHQKPSKKLLKITSAITLTEPKKSPIKAPTIPKTRRRKPQALTQPKQQPQPNIFNSEVKLNQASVLRKEKHNNRGRNGSGNGGGDGDGVVERNLGKPVFTSQFRIKCLMSLRPIPTKLDLKRQRQKAIQMGHLTEQEARKFQQTQMRPYYPIIPLSQNFFQSQPEQPQLSSQPQPEQPQSTNNPNTITTLKQNIHKIIKSSTNSSTTFKNLHTQYCNLYGNVSPAALFIGMLHLANQRYIDCGQMGARDFRITRL